MKIFITGIGGFLGSSLAAHLRSQGHNVSGSSSRATGDGIIRHRLGDPPPVGVLAGHDVVVHCSHDFSVGAAPRNREGTRAIFAAAQAAGVKRQIYVGSHSARPDSPSRYGANKFAIEQDVLANGGSVLRPGLIVGTGGMFAKLVRDLEKRSLVPLVYPDSKTVAVIALPDLLAACSAVLDTAECRAWNLFSAPQISLREFVETAWKAQGRSGRVISVAPWFATGGLRALEFLGMGGVTRLDSLRAQLANQQQFHQSDLLSLVPRPAAGLAAVEEGARQCL